MVRFTTYLTIISTWPYCPYIHSRIFIASTTYSIARQNAARLRELLLLLTIPRSFAASAMRRETIGPHKTRTEHDI